MALTLSVFTLQSCTPIMNLRNINPYVESAFQDWQNMQLCPNASRQAAPLVVAFHDVAGTSSFGMSGVNAHALLEADIGSSRNQKQPWVFAKERLWCLTPAYLLATFVISNDNIPKCLFHTDTLKPMLAYLQHCRVNFV